MNSTIPSEPTGLTRREFLKNSGKAVAGAALVNAMATPGYAAEDNTIKIALVGCGGRGTGAAVNALSTKGPTKLWAMADVFPQRLESSRKNLEQQFPKLVDASPERCFIGLDAFKKAIDSLAKGDVVLLTTPPAFRPIHFAYAVQKGVNVFMEKSFAVDGPGIRRVRQTGELATQKNLKVAGGLMSRHSQPLEEAISRIHEGIIGDVITEYAYRVHGPVGFAPRASGMSELAHQIANYSCYTWLNGSFIVDWLIHNIDVCCWVKNAWPVSVQGSGGRQVRTEQDQLFDHYQAEYTFADGTRMLAQGRHITGCWEFFGDNIHGTKGCAVLGEGIPSPRIYKGHRPNPENLIWQFENAVHEMVETDRGATRLSRFTAPVHPPKKSRPLPNAYQAEHDLFFDAIRNNKPYNETERCAKSCLTAIMGRMACESGRLITWDEAVASNLELAPGLESLTWESAAPVMPDANGRYPIAMPGQTKAL